MEKKFTILRVIGTLYKIAGVLVALGTVLLVILEIVGAAAGDQFFQQYGYGLGSSGPVVAFIGVIITFLGGGLSALGIYAIGEGLYLLISLEENTRFTAILLRDRFYPQPQQPMMPPQQPPMMPPQQPMMPPQSTMRSPQPPFNPPPSYPSEPSA